MWNLPPELQVRLEAIMQNTKKLQQELEIIDPIPSKKPVNRLSKVSNSLRLPPRPKM